MQAARQSAEAEAESLKAEVDTVVARQQERVADWEAAVAEEESALAAKQQELQASHVPAVPATTVVASCTFCRPNTPDWQAFQSPNKRFSFTEQMRFTHLTNAQSSPRKGQLSFTHSCQQPMI